MKVERISMDLIKPYWRNPRNNKNAVKAVADSIKKYGYVQPILLDSQMVIIAGHTRYQALKTLGFTECDVVISDMDEKKAKEYRIVDNKTNELSDWDMSKLFQELGEIGEGVIGFSDQEMEKIIGTPITIKDVTDNDIARTEQKIATRFDAPEQKHATFAAPVQQFDDGDKEEWDGDDLSDDDDEPMGDHPSIPAEYHENPPMEDNLCIEFPCPHCGKTIKMFYNDLISQYKAIRQDMK